MAPRTTKATETEIDAVTDPAAQQVVKRAVEGIVPELMARGEDYSEEALLNAETYADFERLVREQHGDIETAAEVLGDGFSILRKDDKGRLAGIPVLVMSWTWNKGDYDTPFVSLRVIARFPGGAMGKYIVNDSGAGIAEQIAKYEIAKERKTGKRPSGGLFLQKGFTASTYDKEIDGKTITATTYYIDTATA